MDSADVYENKADEFLRLRDKSTIGSKVVNRWAHDLSNGSSVLELACGGGEPITRSLHSVGLKLRAVESSPTLASVFQSRFPDVPIQCAKVQQSDFFNQHFDGVIAVGLMFLLPEDDQIELIYKVSKSLLPAGRFLFTAPIEVGDWIDKGTGAMCISLGQAAYEEHCKIAGLNVISTFTDTGDNNYYATEKSQ